MAQTVKENTELLIDEKNRGQAKMWDGPEGINWKKNEEKFNAAVRRQHAILMKKAGISENTRVLDIGCGCGQTTLEAAHSATSGCVLGIDLSAPMLDQARQKRDAEGITNARFVQGDAQIFPFEEESYDTAISRYGVMFFADPAAAFRNIAAALTPEGRMVFLVWQALSQNEWLSLIARKLDRNGILASAPPGTPNPFALEDPARIREVFTAAGLQDIEVEDVREPVFLGKDTAEAVGLIRLLPIARQTLSEMDEDSKKDALDRLGNELSHHQMKDGISLGSASWVITAHKLTAA